MALLVAPPKAESKGYSHLKAPGAPSAPALHDTLRSGVGPGESASASTLSSHPLEHRLREWETTHDRLRMEMLRRTYGLAEPVRREMELKIVKDSTWRPATLGGNLPHMQEDILRGRDTTVTWEDVFTDELQIPWTGIHDEMERKIRTRA